MNYALSAIASAFRWKLGLAALFLFAGMQASFAQADLAIQGAAVTPTSVAVGNNITATSTIYNLGSSSATSSNIGYYLSTNSTLDASDTFIGSSTGGTLSASGFSGSSSYRNATVTIPSGTAAGSYFLLFVADYLNVVAETNETNNISTVSISVVPQSVDFVITSSYISASSVAPGSSIYLEGYVTNQGNMASSSSNVGFYLSANTTLDASDVFIGSNSGSGVAAGDYRYFYSTVTVPGNTAPGSYYIIFAADYLNQVTENNETNNTSNRALTVVAPFVDLMLQSAYMYSTSAIAGSSVGTEVTIANQGNTAAPSSNIGYYLSTNTTFDAEDIFIGSSTGGSLSAGSSSYRSSSVTIPGNTATGNYYLFFVADYLNTVTESNESNNTVYRALTIVAPFMDLALQSPYLYSSSVTAGSSLGTEVTVVNLGNSTAPSSNIGYYLSANSTFDAEDVFIGSSSGGSITAGNYNYRSHNVSIPANTTAGTYRLFFIVDYLNQLAESNETNNAVSVAISVVVPTIDLTLFSPSVSQTTVSAGNPVSVGVSIYNQGNATSPSSNIGYYLSTNSSFDASDILIGFQNGSSMSAGNYTTRSASVTIPGNTAPGTYYLFIVADYLNSVVEGNETNNAISVVLNVTEQGTTFLMPVSGSLNFTTCTGTIYDNGGTGNYSDYVNGTVTLNPAVSGNKIRLTFSSLSMEYCCDYLYIYDGTSTSAPLIGTYNGSSNPGTVYATNSAGALTLRFYSDGSSVSTGFEAAIACVTTVPLADLVVQNPFVNPTSVVAGSSVSVNSQIYNQGGVTASSSNVGYYLSTNNTFDPSDIFLGYSTVNSLTSSQISSRAANLNIPASTAAGSYNILFVADYSSIVNEENEANNVASVAITVQAATIDLLMLSAFTSSSTLTPGNSFTASGFIANQGASTSPTSNVGYYLSANNTFESTDLFLGSSTGGTLTSGNSAFRSAGLSLPSAITAGTYYIFYVADHTDAVAETNETNNIRSVAVTVTSANFVDLTVQTKELAATTVVAGESVLATANVKNNGNVAAPRNAVGFYLSANTTLDQNDILLNSNQTAGTLAAGATEAVAATLTIPANTEAGSYYILFKSDYENHIAESDNENDLTHLAITVVAASVDLVVQTADIAPGSVPAGNTVAATASIRNQGSVAAASSSIGYYLSADNALDASDVLLDFSAGNALAAGATASKAASLSIPSGTAPGSYFILFVADHATAEAESNETNNVRAVALTVVAPTVDLAIQTPVASAASVVAGTGITLTANVVNNGTVASAATTIAYYLSQNNTFESGDVVLGTSDVATIASAGSLNKVVSYTIPENTPAGNYFILFRVDPDNTNTDSNESNNIASVALAVTLAGEQVDLTVQSPVLSATSVASGDAVTASGTISNSGTSPASSSSIGYYLSADEQYSSTDVLLGASSGGTLAAGATASRSASLTIPAATAAGSYYILFAADHANAVSETNEANNVVSLAIAVTVPPRADLQISASSVAGTTTVAGDTISATVTVLNNGEAPAAASSIGYYISARNVWDNTAIRLGQREVSSIAVGGSTTQTANLVIPANTAAGAYYILVKADDAEVVQETDEANNESSIAVTLAVPVVDLTVQPAAFVASVTAGNSYSFSTEIRNTGNVAAASSNVGLFLSSNTTLESTDLVLGSISGGPLGAGSVAVRSSSITIPAATTQGTYYILVVADPTGVVTESNEANNMQTVTITVVAPLLPDLRVHTPSVSTNPVSADNFTTISGVVTNIGTADAPAGKVNYYLSANNTFESTDVLLGESNLLLLSAGVSSTVSATVRIPANTASGSYFVLLVADVANLIAEKDENNNMASIALTVSPPAQPVLVINSATASRTIYLPGDSVAVTTILQNNGLGSAATSSIGYYISDKNVLDNTATLLEQRQVTSLAAGGTATYYAYLTVPAGKAAGAYYILVKADDTGVVTESNETNNVRSIAVTVIAPEVDLLTENVTFVGTVYAGNSYNISAGIKNNGNVAAPSSNVGIYLSANTTLDNSDVLLRSITGGSLAAGSIATRSSSIIVPVGTAPGTYYILAVVDHTGVVTESDETNNSRSYAINVLAVPALPDLNLHTPALGTASVRAGDNAAVSNIVTNAGTADAPAGKVNYYLSVNNTFDAGDILLGESNLPLLVPGASSTQNASVLIPVTTAGGSYYLLMVADAANAIQESDKTNNVKSVPVNVVHALLPDIYVYSSAIFAKIVAPGGHIWYDGMVSNKGNANALAGSVSYYLSADKTYDAADIYLAEASVPIMEPSFIHYLSKNLIIPANTSVGNYYVLAIADLGNLITELDKTNNLEALPLVVSTTNGVDDVVAESKITVWPNPASDNISIEAANFGKGEKVAEVSLYNAIGEKIMTRKVTLAGNSLKTSLNVRELNTGLYHVHIRVGDAVKVRKVVIQR